jgi:hypothetical protein
MGRWHRQILPRMPFSRRQLCQRRRRNRQRQTEGTPAYRPRKPGPRRPSTIPPSLPRMPPAPMPAERPRRRWPAKSHGSAPACPTESMVGSVFDEPQNDCRLKAGRLGW